MMHLRALKRAFYTDVSASRPRRPTTGLSVALAVAVCAFCLPAPSQAQYSVRPVIHHFPAGSEATRVSRVKNEGDDPRQLRIYAADFDRDRQGSHRFLSAGRHDRSCADRMEVFPDQVHLEPGEAAEVRVTLRPGARTCWSVVFLETVQQGTGGMRIGQRIGVKVYGHGTGATQEASVDSVAASAAGDSVAVEFTVLNSGELPVRPVGAVEIRSFAGEVVAERPLQPFGVLPGSRRVVEVRVDADLDPGRYLAVPILDIGADYLLGGQASFTASSTASAAGDG